MNLKSYAPETFVLCVHFNHEFLYMLCSGGYLEIQKFSTSAYVF